MSTVLIPARGKRKSADLWVSGCFEKDRPSKELGTLEPEFAKSLSMAIEKKRFSGKFGEIFASYSGAYREAPELMALGLGQKKNYRPACFRKAMGVVAKKAKEIKAAKVRICLDSFTAGPVNLEVAAGRLSEISQLALYRFDRYKSKKEGDGKPPPAIIFEAMVSKKDSGAKLQKQIDWYHAVSEGVVRARNLINEPANIMNPEQLAREARQMAEEKKLICKILGTAELKQLKMNGILAVNQGSRTPPALIILEYGRFHKRKGTLCLVGKGVTFDTGGISIKPAKDMEKMKYDMSGAAAVIAILGVVADLKLPLHVVGLAPAVENMVAENPQRPGDIIRMYNGKTVEVLNTDAEGRLILADALAYAAKYSPKAIIDLATLTGMCAATFGDKAIGLLGNDAKLINRVMKAGEEAGERCWQLPLWEEYADQIKGYHSDLCNIGGPYGGTITAAMFLKEFVPAKTPWVHLDIAGTAWCDSPRYDCPKGGTGVGVKLLARFLTNWSGK